MSDEQTGRIVTPEEARALLDEATPGPWVDDEVWAAISSGSDSVVHAYVETTCDGCGAEINDDATVAMSAEDAALIAAAPDLAYTVEQQGQQIAAVKAVHSQTYESFGGLNICEQCDAPYPCPTARALGVES